MDDHAVFNGRVAGTDKGPRTLNLNHTDPTVAGEAQRFLMAEGRDVDPRLFRRLKDGHPRTPRCDGAIDCNVYVSHLLFPI